MGSFLAKPITTKHTETKEGNGLRAVASSMQGWRIEMEDEHIVRIGMPGHPDFSFFGVFDGHGGKLTSAYASKHLVDKIAATNVWKENPVLTPELISRAMVEGFLALDHEFRQFVHSSGADDHSGSTAVCGLVTPTHVIVANCGDSRSIIVKTDGTAHAMSEDHKPYNPGEEARIVAAHGVVSMQRVNGDLAVSRALGDFAYKATPSFPPEKQQVSPEPECEIYPRDGSISFLVIACDGIWDVMENEDVARYVTEKHPLAVAEAEAKKVAGVAEEHQDLRNLAESVLDHALEIESRDNLSVVLVSFLPPPPPADLASIQAAGQAPEVMSVTAPITLSDGGAMEDAPAPASL